MDLPNLKKVETTSGVRAAAAVKAQKLATRLANGPTLAFATMRKNILIAMENSYSEQLLAEAEGQRRGLVLRLAVVEQALEVQAGVLGQVDVDVAAQRGRVGRFHQRIGHERGVVVRERRARLHRVRRTGSAARPAPTAPAAARGSAVAPAADASTA